MIKKMCPVCDLPLRAGNYCPRCRKVIRHPTMWEANYYLNEKYPRNEAACGYHKPYLEADRHKDKGAEPKMTVPVRPVNTGRTAPVKPALGNGQRAEGGSPGKKAPKKPLVGNMIITICVLLMIVFNLTKVVNQSTKTSVDWKDEENVYESEEGGYEYKEVDETGIMEAGNPCDGYSHFPGFQAEVFDSMGGFLKNADSGYSVESEDTYSQNYELLTKDGVTSYYESVRSFTMEDEKTAQLDFDDEDYLYQYVDFNYDTVTGELHQYTSCFYEDDFSVSCLEEFLKLAENCSSVSPQDSRISVILEEVRDGLAQKNDTYLMEGIFVITTCRIDSQIIVTVSYNDPLSAADQEI